jgi:hypothetical protein
MAKKKPSTRRQTTASKKPKKLQATDYDNPWKDFIERYFRDFMQFFFPQIEADIDWTKPIVFLDKELQKVVRDAAISKRYADKLVRVHRRNGEPTLVISHIEVQNEGEDDFDTRMYGYNYRLMDRYNCPVVSLAILTDKSRQWRPTGFRKELWGCMTEFRFPIVKLLDFQKDWAALEASQNPFAVVTMAHLKTQASHGKPSEREDEKYELMTMLYDRGYDEQDVLELHNFLDWLMDLPEEFEQRFQARLKAFEEARQMKYVTSIERMAEERGQVTGERSLLLRQLIHKFGTIDDSTLDRINALSIEQLESLGEDLLDFGSIYDLTTWLENQG